MYYLLIIIFAFNITLSCQDQQEINSNETKHPYFIILTSAFAGISHGMSEGFHALEEIHIQNKTGKPYNQKWHNYATLSTIFKVAVGISIYDYSDLEVKKLTKALLWTLAAGAPATQISYNLTIGKNIGWTSPNTGNPLEKFCTIPVFSAILALAILVEIYWQ